MGFCAQTRAPEPEREESPDILAGAAVESED